jgi:hypothetical protein
MKMFIDIHDSANGTLPEGLTEAQFRGVYEQYVAACRAEGVTSLRTHAGLGEGRVFCVSLAPDAEAVRRAHERVGLTFDSITEVTDISSFNMLLGAQAA